MIICTISIILMIGISESAGVNGAIVALKVTIVVLVIALGWAYIDRDNYVPFIPPNTGEFGHFGWSGVMRAAGMIFFAYIGFDAVSTAAQEAKKPQRDMPIGIIGSLAICTVLYVLFAYVMSGIVNYKDMTPTAIYDAINKTKYAWLSTAVIVGILAGYTSVILVMLLGQSRVFFSMSRDGLLPKIFSRRASEIPNAVAIQPAAHGVCEPLLRLPADFEPGEHDQHRHAARICDRVRRHHGHAAHAARCAPPLPNPAGASRADSGHSGLLRHDGVSGCL